MPATPQYNWPLVDALAGTEVWVKHENHTPVGAFKIRGGLVYFDAFAADPAGDSRTGGSYAGEPWAVDGVCGAGEWTFCDSDCATW